MVKFTPGPWKVRIAKLQDRDFGRRHSIVEVWSEAGTGSRIIGTLSNRWGSITQDKQEANARLIAAAPAMYEALKETVQALVDYEWEVIDYPKPRRHINMMDKARAALALADGGDNAT